MAPLICKPCNDGRFSLAELEAFDSEGRCVVTDHGAFVLLNVYGPAITNADSADERFAFKLRFFEARGPVRLHAPCSAKWHRVSWPPPHSGRLLSLTALHASSDTLQRAVTCLSTSSAGR